MAVKVIGGKKLAIALQAISKKVKQGGAARVGFLAGATYPATVGKNGKTAPALSVAQVAFWNEFGTSRAPARPFFRTTVRKNSDKWGLYIAAALPAFDYDGKACLEAIGQEMKDDITASIQRWDTPPNAARTVARKGFNKPLVHTGVMSRSVDYEVTKT